MVLPYSKTTQRDFGLGLSDPAVMTPVIFGLTSIGTTNVPVVYSSEATLRDERGEGPAVETACNTLAKGGGPIILISADPTVAASNGAVTQVGAGPLVTLSGTAKIDARIRVEVVAGGALGTGTFRYSCDGFANDTESERTYSETLTIPSGGTFAVPGLGITLTFAAGTYVAGESYTADVECAAWNATDLAEAFTALAASPLKWRFIACVASKGNGGATAHATLGAALQTQLAAIAVNGKHRRGVIAAEAGEDAASAVLSAWMSTTAARVMAVYGMVRRVTTKPFSGYAFPVTHALDCIVARAAASLPSTDLKRTRSGPLDEIVKLFADEYRTPTGLDDIKLTTLRSYEQDPGVAYIAQGRLKSPANSDFKYFPHGVLMDIACEIVDAVMFTVIGMDLRTVNATGAIDPIDCDMIDDLVNDALEAGLLAPLNADGRQGYVTDARFRVNRSNNFASTGVILTETGIRPRGYVDFINNVLGYVSELAPAAAA